MPLLDVDGDRLHVLDDGVGEAVVFVHGSCGSGAQWRRLASGLKGSYRTLCVDLFGCGYSQPWPIERPWTPADDERALNAVFDLLDGPIHLVAHSGGGCFAYPTVNGHRDRIASLTLFEPVFFNLLHQAGDPLFAEPEAMASRYRAAIDAGEREAAMAGFVDAWARAAGSWTGLPEPVRAMMHSGADRLYHEWRTLWQSTPTRVELAALDLPVLLVKGTRTIASMHRVCEILAATLPNCHSAALDGAGHMAPFTHAEQALPMVQTHLAAAGTGSP